MKYLFLILSFSTFAGTFDPLIVLKKLKEKKDYSIEFCRLTEKQKEFVVKNGADKMKCENKKIKTIKEIIEEQKNKIKKEKKK